MTRVGFKGKSLFKLKSTKNLVYYITLLNFRNSIPNISQILKTQTNLFI